VSVDGMTTLTVVRSHLQNKHVRVRLEQSWRRARWQSSRRDKQRKQAGLKYTARESHKSAFVIPRAKPKCPGLSLVEVRFAGSTSSQFEYQALWWNAACNYAVGHSLLST